MTTLLERLQKFLFPYVPDEPEKRSMLRLLQSLLSILFFTNLAALLVVLSTSYTYLYLPLVVMLVFVIVSYFFLRSGVFFPAQILPPSVVYLLITYIIVTGYGLHDINLIGYAIAINMASLTLGVWAASGFTILTIIAVFSVGYAEMHGLLVSDTSALTLSVSPITISLLLIVAAFVQRILITRLNENLRRAREQEKEQIKANTELRDLQATLEARVERRTAELQESAAQLAQRAAQLEGVSDISSSITAVREIEKLLPMVTERISQRFGFYHTGIFTLSESREYAILSAASSAGGLRMMERKHQLRVGPGSLVGFVANRGIPRIALDVEQDAVHSVNPDLPETRSEIALPLLAGTNLIGVLDVQSTQPGAFSEQDVNILTTLANQVAAAMQNARLYGETREALGEAEKIYRQFVQQGWKQQIASTAITHGYRFSQTGVEQVELTSAGSPGEGTEHGYIVPIRVRDQIIGTLNIKSTESSREWDADELALIQAAADRAALALENARLLDESQRRASKERVIGEISSKISAAANTENILRTAVAELGSIVPDTEITIQFISGNDSAAS